MDLKIVPPDQKTICHPSELVLPAVLVRVCRTLRRGILVERAVGLDHLDSCGCFHNAVDPVASAAETVAADSGTGNSYGRQELENMKTVHPDAEKSLIPLGLVVLEVSRPATRYNPILQLVTQESL